MVIEQSTSNIHDPTMVLSTYSLIECIHYSTMLLGALNKTEKGNKVSRHAQSEGAHFCELFKCKYGVT